ncbi:MAG: knotted carbamoyltransferase YgeW, partial [Candidatus Cloacimonadota bacterium]|nr:knotted carbamoyltransferase YgeW [Candidatus Cloacimonadota bacterium]
MSWAYSPTYGKPLSVAQGMIGLLSRFGTQLVLAHPPGYNLLPEITNLAHKQAKASGGSFQITNDMKSSFQNADVVCPKSWASYEVMQKRKTLLHNGDNAGLANLEQTCLQQNANFQKWECTSELIKLTNKALYMHPLPADITGVNCTHGEVSKQVFEENLLDTYTQAGFKPYIIAAIIFLSKQSNPAAKLEELVNQNLPRLNARRNR